MPTITILPTFWDSVDSSPLVIQGSDPDDTIHTWVRFYPLRCRELREASGSLVHIRCRLHSYLNPDLLSRSTERFNHGMHLSNLSYAVGHPSSSEAFVHFSTTSLAIERKVCDTNNHPHVLVSEGFLTFKSHRPAETKLMFEMAYFPSVLEYY